MRSLRLLAAVAAGLLLTVSAAGSPVPAGATFQTTINGPRMGTGSFTADTPFCRSGTDTESNGRFVGTGSQVAFDRLMSCRDGTGTVTVLVTQTIKFDPSGTGTWQITSGTGDYRTLRGRGTSSLFATGPDSYTESWEGLADFDDVAPSLSVLRLTASRLRRPKGAHLVQVALASEDNVPQNDVSYEARVTAGSLFTKRAGSIAMGKASLSFRIRPAKRVRRIQVAITVSDALGNTRSLSRTLRLRR